MYITGYQPLDFQIMNSDYNARRVIELFEDAISKGYHPNEIEQDIYLQAGVNPSEFTWYDKEMIQRRVEAVYEASRNFDERG